jgi:hypothetical protein
VPRDLEAAGADTRAAPNNPETAVPRKEPTAAYAAAKA